MTRRAWSRIVRLEKAMRELLPVHPAIVLFPGEEAPEGHTGPVVRVQVIDARKTA